MNHSIYSTPPATALHFAISTQMGDGIVMWDDTAESSPGPMAAADAAYFAIAMAPAVEKYCH